MKYGQNFDFFMPNPVYNSVASLEQFSDVWVFKFWYNAPHLREITQVIGSNHQSVDDVSGAFLGVIQADISINALEIGGCFVAPNDFQVPNFLAKC
jgi:hypothetical protein